MPIKNEIWLHIPIRDNLNNVATIAIGELKETNIDIKTKECIFNLRSPYFTGWNVDAIKSYINMLSGVNDKEVTVRINNLYCEFEETLEFLKGISSISGNIKNQKVKTYMKSLTISFNILNIQMIIITYGGKMSLKHCWNNFTLKQAINTWEQNDNRMPRNAEIWLGNKKLTMTDCPVINLKWSERINLMIKGDGGDPEEEVRKQVLELFYEMTSEEKKWLEENAWNSNEKIFYKGDLVKRDWFQRRIRYTANAATVDKLKLVAEEFLQLVEYIGNKIERVEITKYEEKVSKEE
jgi:hypothetical protein